MRKLLTAAVLALWGSVPGVGVHAAEQEVLRYDVRLLGARVGVITIAATERGSAYAARSQFATAGLVGALKKMNADVTVQGLIRNGEMAPRDYAEEINDGDRYTKVQVRFAPGTPTLVSGDPGSSAPPARPSSLGNALDPLTALYAALRDQPRDDICQFQADVFDGHRLARLALVDAQANGDRVTCHGYYRRMEGYSSSRQGRNVPLTVHYTPHGETMRADRVVVETKYGAATMNRR
jgi:hypothetical protein